MAVVEKKNNKILKKTNKMYGYSIENCINLEKIVYSARETLQYNNRVKTVRLNNFLNTSIVGSIGVLKHYVNEEKNRKNQIRISNLILKLHFIFKK